MSTAAAAGPDLRPTGHHDLPAHEVVLLLGTDRHRGLDAADAARRLERLGPNVLPEASRTGVVRRLLRQVHHPLVYVLLASALVTGLLREWVDCGVILGVVVVNAVVGFVQESRAEAALDGLRALVRTTATVVRDGRVRTVPSEDLVDGDLVLLEAGDRVPADLRLVRETRLRTDESALTGEAEPVDKDEVVLPAPTPVADRHNMAYAGTLVTAGSGAGVVVATGGRTELGEIHRLVGTAQDLRTPLTAKLAAFSGVLTVVILGLAALTFAVGVLRGQGAVQTFTAAVALAVGAIPEGLPAAVTVTLAVGVSRMARRRAVVRRLPAVETLGSTTVVCTDKTGTLTENRMTVLRLWTPGGGLRPPDPDDPDPALHRTVLAGVLCNDARADGGDPTETALLDVARRLGVDPDAVRAASPRLATLPFTSERRLMATVHADGDGRLLVVKGAVEAVLPLCRTALGAGGAAVPLDDAAVRHAAGTAAADGLRVLATAVRDGAAVPAAGTELDEAVLTEGPLVLTGLQAMADPPRAGAAAAVAACRSAGVAVKMITGDHAGTATAVARAVGLLEDDAPGRVVTGAELAAVPDDELPDVLERARVLARVTPEQKLRLVGALQGRGHVVAMTGDGVNDAPALRQADIGIAMGRGGTQVAQDAADMVLTDDDFATVEAAVEEGRGVFDNLTKFIVWTLPTNMGEGLVVLVAVLLGTALPILPTQVLWINMTTAVALGLTLAVEPTEPGVMRRPPRDPARPLLTRALVARTLVVSAVLVAGAWWLFSWEVARGAPLAEARTAAVNVFVAVQVLYLFACRTLRADAPRPRAMSNRWLVGGVAAQVAAQLALTYLPVMNRTFGTAPLGPGTWLRVLAVAVAAAALVALHRRLTRHRHW